jgi:hypothetical protein
MWFAEAIADSIYCSRDFAPARLRKSPNIAPKRF